MKEKNNFISRIISVKFLKTSEILSIDRVSLSRCDVLYSISGELKQVYGTIDTFKFREFYKKKASGYIFEQELTFIHPNESDSSFDIYQYLEVPIVMFIYYDNQTVKIVGNLDTPAFIQVDSSSEFLSFSREITIACVSKIPALMATVIKQDYS